MPNISKLTTTITVKTETVFCLIIFPVARFTRAGDVSLLKVLGITVYQSVGIHRSFCGFTWSSEDQEDGLESE